MGVVLNKQEIKYILFSAFFLFIWFVWIIPAIEKNLTNPILQFLVYNVGIFITFVIFFKAFSTNTKASLGSALGMLFLYLAIDLPTPEFHVTMQGTLVEGAKAGMGASDYIVGMLWQSIGLSGFFVYFMTYILTPILFLFLSAIIIPNFVRRI